MMQQKLTRIRRMMRMIKLWDAAINSFVQDMFLITNYERIASKDKRHFLFLKTK